MTGNKIDNTTHSSDTAPFSFDNCYSVVLQKGIKDDDALWAYVETKDEALTLFDALKSVSSGKKLRVFEITKDDEKIIKEK
jgi:hypothetical protein